MAGGSGPSPPSGEEQRKFLERLLEALPGWSEQAANQFRKSLEETLPGLTDEIVRERARYRAEALKKKERETGYVAKFLGDDVDPKIRVAFVIAVLLILLLGGIIIGYFVQAGVKNENADTLQIIVTGILSLLTGALGFIIGRHDLPTPTGHPSDSPATRKTTTGRRR